MHPIRKKPQLDIPTQMDAKLKQGEYTDIDVDTEDHSTIMFRFEDGVKGVLIAAQVCPGSKQFIEWEINGSEKSMSWNGQKPNILWIGNRSGNNEIFFKDANVLDEKVKKYAPYPVGLAEGYPDSHPEPGPSGSSAEDRWGSPRENPAHARRAALVPP